MKYTLLFFVAVWGCSQLYSAGVGGPFLEKNGIVVFEAESTASDLGKWVEKTEIDGFNGSGYMEFTGHSPGSSLASSPLEYEFKITLTFHKKA